MIRADNISPKENMPRYGEHSYVVFVLKPGMCWQSNVSEHFTLRMGIIRDHLIQQYRDTWVCIVIQYKCSCYNSKQT